MVNDPFLPSDESERCPNIPAPVSHQYNVIDFLVTFKDTTKEM